MPFIPTNWNATPRPVSSRRNQFADDRTRVEYPNMPQHTRQIHQYHPLMSNPYVLPSKPPPKLTLDVSGTTTRQDGKIRQPVPVDSPKVDVGRKKKVSDVFGFLTLREPSSSAWQDFAKKQRSQATQRAGKPVTVGSPRGSSQKLPSHVPKVNSKWDGLPESTRKMGATRQEKNVMKDLPPLPAAASRRTRSLLTSDASSASSSTYKASCRSPRSETSQSTIKYSPIQRAKTMLPQHQKQGRALRNEQGNVSHGKTSSSGAPFVDQTDFSTTFFIPPSPVLLPLYEHAIPTPDLTYYQTNTSSRHTSTLLGDQPSTSYLDDDTDTALAALQFTDPSLTKHTQRQSTIDDHRTFWLSDSDDLASDQISAHSRPVSGIKQRPLSIQAATFYIHEDGSSSDVEDTSMLGYRSKTCAISSRASNASTWSATSASIFSANRSDASTRSTNASSIHVHAGSSGPRSHDTLPPSPSPLTSSKAMW